MDGGNFEERLREKCRKSDKRNGKTENTFDSIRKSDIDIFSWFEQVWLAGDRNRDKKTEDIQFFLWLEDSYTEHLIAHNNNKEKYFSRARMWNRYESITQEVSRMTLFVREAAVLLLGTAVGANAGKILNYINNLSVISQMPKGFKIVLTIAVLLLLMTGLICVLRIMIGSEYAKRLSKIEEEKETWLRHGETLMNYQEVLLAYLWNIGIFKKYAGQEMRTERDDLLIEEVLKVWKNDMQKFQSNMSPVPRDNQK